MRIRTVTQLLEGTLSSVLDLQGFPSGCWNWVVSWADSTVAGFSVFMTTLMGHEKKSMQPATFIPSTMDTILFTCVHRSFTEGLFCPPSQWKLGLGGWYDVCGGVRMTLSSEFILHIIPFPPERTMADSLFTRMTSSLLTRVPLVHTPLFFA